MNMKRLPLEGIRILDLSRQLPGPLATRLLADFGADVIKIEDTRNGDDFRSTTPKINGISARHLELNRNKRGLAIDLKSAEGKEIFLKLAAESDVVFEQFRPGVVKRLGIDYESVKQVNPKVIYCSLSGFGQDGPYRDLVAHDPNYLSLSGVLSLIGAKGGAPVMTGPQLADITAANMVTIGILLALRKLETTGVGEYLDISLFDSAFSLPVTALANYFGSGQAPSRGEERHNGKYPWGDIYRAKDGGYISVTAVESHFYKNLCHELGRDDWADLQYADDAKQEEIRAAMKEIFARHTRDEWFEKLKGKDVCVSPVLSIEEAVNSEQVRARGNIIEHNHPVAGPTRLLASPIRMQSGVPPIRMGAPLQGEHGAEILSGLGYSEGEIKQLSSKGVVLTPPAP
ncbi:MAG: Crotonobetainyl-CoA:carnitine CoA-transferase CaiB [Herminiimonas sp.]|nr:Crotonobetainyl-CoA:carnitine CoA-transferase CaiB [Herminiimonas sp.]